MNDTIIRLLFAVIYGVAVGAITIPLSCRLIKNRVDEAEQNKANALKKLSVWFLMIIAGVASSAAITLTAKTTELLVRNLVLLIPIFSISCVDAVIRRIPNSLLLSMLSVQGVYLIYYCISNKSVSILSTVFVGFFIGMVVCTIPSILKIPMGAGDIKYSGIIGITLYAFGYFQAMIFMALLVAIFFVYLKIKKKGGMKTQIPMGPFLSIGTVISMCFLITDFI